MSFTTHRHPPTPEGFYEPVPGYCRLCQGAILDVCGTLSRRRTWHDHCLRLWRVANWPSHARIEVWKRDHGVCAHCGSDENESGQWEVDHKIALRLAPRVFAYWLMGNLQTLCLPCHHIKTKEDHHAWRTLRDAKRPD